MSTPEHIKKMIEDYRQPRENVVITPEVIKYHDQIYYGASYHQGRDVTGYLILTVDGNIIPKQEAIEVQFIAQSISGIASVFFRSTRGLMRKKFVFVRWAYKMLKKLEQKYADEPEGLKYIQSFRKAMESTLHNHQSFKEKGLEQKQLLQKMMQEETVFTDLFYKSREIHLEMGRCLFFINYDQMQSYQDRGKAIQFLLKKGDIFRALGLLFVHLQLHPPYVKERNREDFEFTKTRYIDHKVPKEEVQILEESISKMRNPNLSGAEENPRQLAINFLKTLDEPVDE